MTIIKNQGNVLRKQRVWSICMENKHISIKKLENSRFFSFGKVVSLLKANDKSIKNFSLKLCCYVSRLLIGTQITTRQREAQDGRVNLRKQKVNSGYGNPKENNGWI